MSYYHGQYATDEIMKDYVKFLCSHIKTDDVGASVHRTDGFPMKGYYIRVKLEILEILSRSAEMKLTVFGHEKVFICYMSRHKSPDKILHELQNKIDELTLEIITEQGLDRDKIWQDHHPLRWLKFGQKKEV